MADNATAIIHAVDAFIWNSSGLRHRIRHGDFTQRDVNEVWGDWARVVRWAEKLGKPHNYSRGVLAARKLRESMDKAGLED